MGAVADFASAFWATFKTSAGTNAQAIIALAAYTTGLGVAIGAQQAADAVQIASDFSASARAMFVTLEGQWSTQIYDLNNGLQLFFEALAFANLFLDLQEWATMFGAAYTLILFIRATRWALSFVPMINGG